MKKPAIGKSHNVLKFIAFVGGDFFVQCLVPISFPFRFSVSCSLVLNVIPAVSHFVSSVFVLLAIDSGLIGPRTSCHPAQVRVATASRVGGRPRHLEQQPWLPRRCGRFTERPCLLSNPGQIPCPLTKPTTGCSARKTPAVSTRIPHQTEFVDLFPPPRTSVGITTIRYTLQHPQLHSTFDLRPPL